MRIAICGSMNFAKEMLEIKKLLESKGHFVYVPGQSEDYANGLVEKIGGIEGAERKIKYDLIRDHHNKIVDSEAILVLNYDKKGIKNYIGGNSFLEIGFAYILGRKIYILNELPDIEIYKQEIIAMQPIVLNGDLETL